MPAIYHYYPRDDEAFHHIRDWDDGFYAYDYPDLVPQRDPSQGYWSTPPNTRRQPRHEPEFMSRPLHRRNMPSRMDRVTDYSHDFNSPRHDRSPERTSRPDADTDWPGRGRRRKAWTPAYVAATPSPPPPDGHRRRRHEHRDPYLPSSPSSGRRRYHHYYHDHYSLSSQPAKGSRKHKHRHHDDYDNFFQQDRHSMPASPVRSRKESRHCHHRRHHGSRRHGSSQERPSVAAPSPPNSIWDERRHRSSRSRHHYRYSPPPLPPHPTGRHRPAHEDADEYRRRHPSRADVRVPSSHHAGDKSSRSCKNGKSRRNSYISDRWQKAAAAAFQSGAMTAYNLRGQPGPWNAEKGAQIATAAISAAAMDAIGQSRKAKDAQAYHQRPSPLHAEEHKIPSHLPYHLLQDFGDALGGFLVEGYRKRRHGRESSR